MGNIIGAKQKQKATPAEHAVIDYFPIFVLVLFLGMAGIILAGVWRCAITLDEIKWVLECRFAGKSLDEENDE